jgi:hypothetical protein
MMNKKQTKKPSLHEFCFMNMINSSKSVLEIARSHSSCSSSKTDLKRYDLKTDLKKYELKACKTHTHTHTHTQNKTKQISYLALHALNQNNKNNTNAVHQARSPIESYFSSPNCGSFAVATFQQTGTSSSSSPFVLGR